MPEITSQKKQIQEKISSNRYSIQRYEKQMDGKYTLLGRYQEQLEVLQSAIGNLDTVLVNLEAVENYYKNVYMLHTQERNQWAGMEFRFADMTKEEIDHQYSSCILSVETMKQEMETKWKELEDHIGELNAEILTMKMNIVELQMKNNSLRARL